MKDEIITAVKSGKFSDPETWDKKRVPGKGVNWIVPDSIEVSMGKLNEDDE
ncbi:unnamed protein product [marine sediment metagenome]|uniref:Uncharacterized protein n=1 Tax=marine sediment metagenome TaxID=412755 RepID=X1BTR8_9ZZZZ